ncbi:MAG: homoserine kinase [Chloroflexi bacterium]|nr:homoserine kinase [Ardenticatenaceae bacterium]MBL1130103.1 homoserine kinase [Chloroflexota bacterium]NOG36189.1 homoserine kinase [Chloroflexota bacterium]GIK56243.1 MAG: homoserine kinase [Chloroflexota bacterium]
MTQVTVSIPATSANLGPGFDCLGLALALYNRITFTAVPPTPSPPPLTITVSGVDAHKVATDESNLVYQCANIIFDKAGQRPSPLHIHQENNIPVGSGLGSSSTAVLGGMLAANELVARPFTTAQILQFAAEKEGHPDNVAPAFYGGLVLGVAHETGLHIERFTLPELQAVVVLPDFHLLTSEARAALPTQVSRQDAIFNAARTPLVIRALQTADYDLLRIAMQDRLHQPYRIPLIPGMAQAFAAAQASGAKGVALSGAGPSLIAFAPDGHERIAAAVTAVFAQHGLASRTWVLTVDNGGVDSEILGY